jgi:serine O-acetyltransferase
VTYLTEAIHAQLAAALWECCPPNAIHVVRQTCAIERTVIGATEDLYAFARKDPAASGDVFRILQAYTSFKAVLHYRLAHAIETLNDGCINHLDQAALYAPLISARGKMLSGAELHHKCKIGRRFVLDHGVGTVFGETAEIGDDCYVLGGVTLGAGGIADNPSGKRHPTLGHRVEIGAFSRVYGPVHVGDDVFIGPHCTVAQDIEQGSRILLRSSLQITKKNRLFGLHDLPA